MEERNVTVTLEKAKEWYNSDNATLKEVALQAFSEEELNTFDYTKVKTFKDALLCICKFDSCEYNSIVETVNRLRVTSKASAAMFMLNIVRKVLNTGYNMHLTKNVKGQSYTWYPYFRFVTKSSTFYDKELKSGEYKKLGEITSEGVTYNVLGSGAAAGYAAGLGDFDSCHGVGHVDASFGFLGCATKEIAKHFGLYFGMDIIEAMYGDLPNTTIKY